MTHGLVRIGCPKGFDAQKLKVTLSFDGTTYEISYSKGDGDYIRAGGLNYLNCTEFRPGGGKGKVEIERVYSQD